MNVSLPSPIDNAPKSSRLGMVDTASLIVGIVIGTAIFRSAPLVFRYAGSAGASIGVWLVGGLLSFCGALCYAEMATAIPRNGGDYQYLTRAYGRWAGFLFGWAQLTVILSGNIGAMAYAFADYAAGLWRLGTAASPWIAALAVLVTTMLNLAGIVAGKTSQNLLTLAKVSGLAAVVVAGAALAVSDPSPRLLMPSAESPPPDFGLALVFVMYAYGGWNDAACVAAEVRNVERNLPRALILGLGVVTVVYVAVNLVYLAVLGYSEASHSTTPAADVLERAIGPWGDRAIRILIMISALGAINGLVLTGSRVFAVFGQDNRLLEGLGSAWGKGTPLAALAAQAIITLAMILTVGTPTGQALIDRSLLAVGLEGLPWENYQGGFDALVAGAAPTFWFFFLLTGIGVFVLRAKTPTSAYRFRIPWFPIPAVLFCASCLFMLYRSLDYARWLALIGAFPLLIGMPLGFFHRSAARAR